MLVCLEWFITPDSLKKFKGGSGELWFSAHTQSSERDNVLDQNLTA